MKTIKITVTSNDKDDKTGVSYHVEQPGVSGGWNRVDGADGVTNMGETVLNVRPGQRVVIEAYPQPEAVYDRAQGAAVNPNSQKNKFGVADEATRDTRLTSAQDQEKSRLAAAAEQQGRPASRVSPNPDPETSNQAAESKSGPQGQPLTGASSPNPSRTAAEANKK